MQNESPQTNDGNPSRESLDQQLTFKGSTVNLIPLLGLLLQVVAVSRCHGQPTIKLGKSTKCFAHVCADLKNRYCSECNAFWPTETQSTEAHALQTRICGMGNQTPKVPRHIGQITCATCHTSLEACTVCVLEKTNWSADPIFKTSPEKKTEQNIFTIYKPPTLTTCSDFCIFPQTGSLVKGFYSLFKKCPNGCAGYFGRMILSPRCLLYVRFPQPRGVRLGVGCRVFLSVISYTHDRNILSWRIMFGVYAVVISCNF